jgi:hypothetical protein
MSWLAERKNPQDYFRLPDLADIAKKFVIPV